MTTFILYVLGYLAVAIFLDGLFKLEGLESVFALVWIALLPFGILAITCKAIHFTGSWLGDKLR